MKNLKQAMVGYPGKHDQQHRHWAGFTLMELLAVVAILGLLALTLVPALAGSRTKAQGVRCLDNMRQLMGSVLMFAHDHHDLLPPNPDDGSTMAGYVWCRGNAGLGAPDEFDPDILNDPKWCLVAPYLNSNASVFHCTADTRTGLYDGAALYPASPLKGKVVPAARTLSMSQAVGTVDPGYSGGGFHSGIPNLPVNGPWLTGTYGQNTSRTGPWRTYGKISQMVVPVPADLIVLTEESPFGLNDDSCATAVNPQNPQWIDFPSTLHNNGCVVGFADGHVDLHKWIGSSMFLSSGAPGPRRVLPTDPDWLWFTQRTSARF